MPAPWAARNFKGMYMTLWRAKKQRELEGAVAAGAAALTAEIAAMQNNIALKKLKMHCAKMAGMMDNFRFRAPWSRRTNTRP